jgi:DNA-binding NtrC family response regulator
MKNEQALKVKHKYQAGFKKHSSKYNNFVTLTEFERQVIMKVMAATGGNKAKSADALGISRYKLYRKLKSLSLDQIEFNPRISRRK